MCSVWGKSGGEAAHSGWRGLTRLGNFPYILNLEIRIIKKRDEFN